MPTARWIDLWVPDEAAVRAALPPGVHDITVARLLRPIDPDRPARPRLETRDHYVFGVFAAPGYDGEHIVIDEVDVVMTHDVVVTVHKTARSRASMTFDAAVATAGRTGVDPGQALFTIVDEVAEIGRAHV